MAYRDKIIYVLGYDNKARWKKALGGQYGCLYIDEINIADMEYVRGAAMRCDYLLATLNPGAPVAVFCPRGVVVQNPTVLSFSATNIQLLLNKPLAIAGGIFMPNGKEALSAHEHNGALTCPSIPS